MKCINVEVKWFIRDEEKSYWVILPEITFNKSQ